MLKKILIKQVIKELSPELALEIRHGWAKFECRLQLIQQRSRCVLKSPLTATSAEEWCVQKLRVPGSPLSHKPQLHRNCKTEVKLLPD